MIGPELYKSGEIHRSQQASEYSKANMSPHRFLAYRDFVALIKDFESIGRVLDFGSGTGASSLFLFEQGFDVVGVDKSKAMLEEARASFPDISFVDINNLNSIGLFDLVFSSFVLFELENKKEIIDYLNLAYSMLEEGGIFFGITGSEHLHKRSSEWLHFNVDYTENICPSSGDIVKLRLEDPDIEFSDYYWTENDYKECFGSSELELIQVYYPTGNREEPFDWKCERSISPFVIFIARKL